MEASREGHEEMVALLLSQGNSLIDRQADSEIIQTGTDTHRQIDSEELRQDETRQDQRQNRDKTRQNRDKTETRQDRQDMTDRDRTTQGRDRLRQD